MGIERVISEKGQRHSRFFGIKCKYPDEIFWTERITYCCEICEKKETYSYSVNEYLNTPTMVRKKIDDKDMSFEKISWGYRGYTLWICKTHTELEIDKKVDELKRKEKR